jgi:hypothetical protein
LVVGCIELNQGTWGMCLEHALICSKLAKYSISIPSTFLVHPLVLGLILWTYFRGMPLTVSDLRQKMEKPAPESGQSPAFQVLQVA